MTEPLTERKGKILAVLIRHLGGLGFNELCTEVGEYAARQTVKNELDELIRLGLVEKQAGRRGQKVHYVYKPFAEFAKSINSDLEGLTFILKGLREEINRIEKKVGKPLQDITIEEAHNPTLRRLIPLMVDGFANAYMIIYLAESRYPPRLREVFVKEVEQPARELSDKIGRILLLNPEFKQDFDCYIDEKTNVTRRFLRRRLVHKN